MTEIRVDHSKLGIILKICKASRPTVRKALRGQCSSPLSIRIREIAMQHGGKEYQLVESSRKPIKVL